LKISESIIVMAPLRLGVLRLVSVLAVGGFGGGESK
jgi:hypothetical protein